jgi:hypothetical protein
MAAAHPIDVVDPGRTSIVDEASALECRFARRDATRNDSPAARCPLISTVHPLRQG